MPDRLRTWISTAWSLRMPSTAGWSEDVWPTLHADLVVPLGVTYRRGEELVDAPTLDGIGLSPRRYVHRGAQCLVGVQFRPGGVATLLGPGRARELAGAATSLEVLGLSGLGAQAQRQGAHPDAALTALLDGLALARRGPRPWPGLGAALAWLERGRRVRETAARLGVSERTLERGMRDATGLRPKEAQRLLRFRLAARQLDASPASLGHGPALGAGYHDQPHFSRECRALTGRSPRTWWLSASDKCGLD